MSAPEIVIVGIDGSAVRFRDVPDFPGYLVGEDGSVWTSRYGRRNGWVEMGRTLDRQGYARIGLCSGSAKSSHFLHDLILRAFVGPRPAGMQCAHADGDRTNNRLYNLRWDTPLGNSQDKYRHGTMLRGDRHHQAKLTTQDVLAIRRLARVGIAPVALARRFGVAHDTVGKILRRKTWRHVPPEE